MKTLAFAIALIPSVVIAEDWTPLSGAEIKAALSEKTVTYARATQHFRADGQTTYNDGRDSLGYWAVRGDRYCSRWPPGDRWDCYDVAAAQGKIRFVGADGSTTDGQFGQ